MSEFSLTNLVGMPVYFVALFAFELFISLKMSSLSTNEKLKGILELPFSLIAIMLGWALYLTIPLITGSDIGFCSLYCGILRFWINSKKEIIQNLSSFFIIFKNFGSFNKCYFITGHSFVRQQWFN